MQESIIGVSGHLKIVVTDHSTGDVKEYEYKNKITNALLARIAQWMAGVNNTGQNPAYVPSKFQLGTGTGTPASTDTALFTPSAGSLVNAATVTYSSNTTTLTINYAQNFITGTFTEAGLLDVNSVLLTHVTLTPSLQIVANQSVSITYVITMTAQ